MNAPPKSRPPQSRAAKKEARARMEEARKPRAPAGEAPKPRTSPADAPKPGEKVETIRVSSSEAGMRLDRWFKVHFPEVGYGYLQKLLRSGQVRVNSKRAEANDRLEAGFEVRVPAIVRQPKNSGVGLKAPPGASKGDRDAIEKMIIYEDLHVLVLNKPFGLAVQGGTGTKKHIDGMLASMIERFDGERPRLVHRIDRDTTGILLVALTREAAAKLGRTFQTRSAAKTYWALVKGVPKPPQGKIEAALVKASGPDGDRVRKALPGEQDKAMHATTHYSVIDRAAHKASWVSLKPVTGRQHQLRAHMHMIGHPIVGDNKYEGDQNMPAENMEVKLHLHARRLVIPHPITGETIDVTAPLPPHMKASFKLLGFDEKKFGSEED